MQYISRELAAERRRELQRQAEAARLARQARRSRPREGADGGRLSGDRPAGGRPSGEGRSGGRLSGGRPRRGGLAWGWRRLSRRVAGALADGARAQRRAAVLNASLDRRLPYPHQPPATYQEFLARTAGPLLCEPPAIARYRGRPVG